MVTDVTMDYCIFFTEYTLILGLTAIIYPRLVPRNKISLVRTFYYESFTD